METFLFIAAIGVVALLSFIGLTRRNVVDTNPIINIGKYRSKCAKGQCSHRWRFCVRRRRARFHYKSRR